MERKNAILTKAVKIMKLKCNVFNSARKPSNTGPTKKPMFVVAAIIATPSEVLMLSTLEASRYTSGTITENPSPTMKKPTKETVGYRIKTSMKPTILKKLE
jgi:hypothetical protein